MYLAVPSQPDCVSAWREAIRAVDGKPGHVYHNVIIDVMNPVLRNNIADPIVAEVDQFVTSKGKKSIETVANTIFPAALYRRHGAPKFYDRFLTNVLPKVKRTGRWSGYYFERMISLPGQGGKVVNQLESIIDRLRDPAVKARNKFELSVFDPERDTDRSPYGGQCMSFASFKKRQQDESEFLDCTVMYRNHFYIEKLLGNIIGIGRLMEFIAKEANLNVGGLTVISTHAEIDLPKGATRQEFLALLSRCDKLNVSV